MKTHLKNIINQLKSQTLTLEKTSLFVDKPWALVDDDFEVQKLIFKSNKELILSKNGKVQVGKWDYFAEAKSILIDRCVDKILCKETFIDKGVMILSLDGTSNDFFILANENIIPDLDIYKYLKALKNRKLNIVERKLGNGKTIEIKRRDSWLPPAIGDYVTIEEESVEEGLYQLESLNRFFEIKESKIYKILIETKYNNSNGEEIVVFQQEGNQIRKGDYALIYGKRVENGIINFSIKKNLVVRNGIVIRLEPKNKLVRWLNKQWMFVWDKYEE